MDSNKIEKESFESCIYKKVFLDYTYGLGKIYSQEEIEKARRSPTFPRELQYQGLIGMSSLPDLSRTAKR